MRRFLIVGLSAFLIALSPHAFSQENRPTAETSASKDQQPAKPNEKGTLASPLIVKTIPAEKSKAEADSDAKEKADKAFYDALTAFVAIGTLAVLFIQTIVFGWQAHRLKQTIDTMKDVATRQSNDMREAIAASRESTEVARQELFSTHRPRVRARRFFLEALEENKPINIRFDMANIGNSPAKIVMHHYHVVVTYKNLVVDHSNYEENEKSVEIKAGEAALSRIVGQVNLGAEIIQGLSKSTQIATAHVVGVIAYRDNIDIKRRTAYWRRYEPEKNGRFSVSDDEDLEYED